MQTIETFILNKVKLYVREEIERYKALDSTKIAKKSLLTVQEASNKLRISTTTLWRLRKEGCINSIKIGNRIFFKEEDIIEYIENTNRYE